MTVYLVGAGPGDPGLLTLRAAELLGRAEVVVHDRLVPRAVLAIASPGARLIDVGKRPGDEGQRQGHLNELLVELGRAGGVVVRLKGGDPFLFGRGGEEALALRAAGVDYEVVPGVSAALAAPAYAGVPVTHRGLAAFVTVVTGRVGDEPGSGDVDWESLARAGGTLVVLMGIARRAEIARRLISAGRPPGTPVAVVRWGTTPAQQSVRTVLSELASVPIEAPATIVIGEVAGLDLDWFTPAPLAGSTVAVTREEGRGDELARALSAAGAVVATVPVLRTEEPEDGGIALARALGDLGRYEWLVLTSRRAVDRVMDGVHDARALHGVRIGVVGPATARALAERGVIADDVAEPATAEGLVHAVGAGSGRVLYPRAEGARDVVPESLRAAGWLVDDPVAYRTVAVRPDDALVAVAARCDAIVFASPSAVDSYMVAAGDRAVPAVVCIGPVTARSAEERGLTVAAVAKEPGTEGMVHAVAEALAGN
ncbi:MAG: uroporphyrinogen-III C-methyltransferase [Acidimicrobiales bacterium]